MSVFTDESGGAKPWVTYAVIALAVGVGGYFVYAAWMGADRPHPVEMMCSTPDCGYTSSERLTVDSSATCPRCQKESLVVGHACPQCKAAVLLNEYVGKPSPTKCPKCGAEVRYGS